MRGHINPAITYAVHVLCFGLCVCIETVYKTHVPWKLHSIGIVSYRSIFIYCSKNRQESTQSLENAVVSAYVLISYSHGS